MKKSFTLPLADAAGKKQSDITFLTLWIRAQKTFTTVTEKFIKSGFSLFYLWLQ